jgi:FkbM family methyltransferase
VGPRGKVFAFEPNPRLAELLDRNIALNGFWHVAEARAAAAGDRDGDTARLVVPVRDPKNGSPALPVLPDGCSGSGCAHERNIALFESRSCPNASCP